MTTQLEHIGIPVQSIEQAKVLYCDLLGYKPFFETEVDMPHFSKIAFLEKGSVRIELQEMLGDSWVLKPLGRIAGLYHLSFAVEDLAGEVKRWSAAGMKLLIPPKFAGIKIPAEEDWWFAYFQGPDGESIELRGPWKD